MTMRTKFKRQDEQYAFPYHYLVSLDRLQVGKVMDTGVEYYSYLRQAIDLIEGAPYQTLLDAGCGEGRLVAYLAPRHEERTFVGADVSERAIALANALNPDLSNARFVAEDVNDLTEQFDVIACVETMEHIPDEDMPQFVAGLRARLKPGGRLVVTVPSVVIPLQKKHYRHYTIELLKEQLTGFSLVSVQYAMRTGWLRDLCVRFGRRFAMVPLAQRLVSFIGERYLFQATAKDGRHVVAVFTIS